ncbi:MAG: DUF192 domain-containing protein [Cyanobacteria bacterium P01_D01_bin.156]
MAKRKWMWGLLAVGSLGLVLTAKLIQSAPENTPVAAQHLPVTAQVVINGTTLDLEVAATAEEQMTGLMFRESLPANRGMLFDLPRPQAQVVWMKDVQFPIDAVFLKEGRVELVLSELPPCKREPCPVYGVSQAVDQVLELNGGQATSLGIVPGRYLAIRAIER